MLSGDGKSTETGKYFPSIAHFPAAEKAVKLETALEQGVSPLAEQPLPAKRCKLAAHYLALQSDRKKLQKCFARQTLITPSIATTSEASCSPAVRLTPCRPSAGKLRPPTRLRSRANGLLVTKFKRAPSGIRATKPASYSNLHATRHAWHSPSFTVRGHKRYRVAGRAPTDERRRSQPTKIFH